MNVLEKTYWSISNQRLGKPRFDRLCSYTLLTMINVELPAQGQSLTNAELSALFKCSPQGGMRRSHRTNSLILISNHLESIYDDRWLEDTLHYTGMGQTGDQQLTFSQNKTLAESRDNQVAVYLFEVFEPEKYFYQGAVQLIASPSEELQNDHQGQPRRVYLFPVRLLAGSRILPASEIVDRALQKKVEQLYQSLSIDVLKREAEKKAGTPSKKQSTRTVFDRDPLVVAYALKRARGICELCQKPAPFRTKKGAPFLEVHHITYLSQGGSDTIDNVAALCPNCHRRVHHLEHQKDVFQLKTMARKLLTEY